MYNNVSHQNRDVLSHSRNLFYSFFDTIYKISPWSTIMFVISLGLAFYRGAIIRDPSLIAYIAIGNIITHTLMKSLLPQIWNNVVQGSILSAVVISLVALIIYLYIRQLTNYPEKEGSII